MNGTQLLITIGYSILVVATLVVAARIVRSTRPGAQGPVDTERLAHGELRWGWVGTAALVALLAATIFAVPYGEGSDGGRRQIVRVTGLQFAWIIKPNVVRAGEPVEFRLTSRDVNHGFALYRGSRLESQVQVMPGKEQRLVHTFEQPGTYRVLCLEFCGFDHHRMSSELRVR